MKRLAGLLSRMLVWVLWAPAALAAQPDSTALACNCDHLITRSGVYFGENADVAPGDTICIQAGEYTHLQFRNFAGVAGKPIYIRNYGGTVTINGTENSQSGLLFHNCQHFRVSGAGGAATYGFHVTRNSKDASAIVIDGRSSACEVDHIEVAGAGFAGIMIKTDPSACNPATWRENFTMTDVHVHHNYVHDVKGEGLYIGNSFWNKGLERACQGKKLRIFPHNITGLEIDNNVVERTGCEGIQYACAPDARVHHNVVRSTGLSPFTPDQDNGVQIGGGVSGRFYSNYIEGAADVGLIVVGHLGNLAIFNNVIYQSGGAGIFCDERNGSLPNTPVWIVNNTILKTGEDGIRLYNETQQNVVANTIIADIGTKQPYKFISYGNGATAKQLNNLTTDQLPALTFVDVAKGNLRLTLRSQAVDKGVDARQWGVTADIANQPRPQGRAYDIGAFELPAAAGPKPQRSEKAATKRSVANVVPPSNEAHKRTQVPD